MLLVILFVEVYFLIVHQCRSEKIVYLGKSKNVNR